MQEGLKPTVKCKTAFCVCKGCPQLVRAYDKLNDHNMLRHMLKSMDVKFECNDGVKCQCVECPRKMEKVMKFLGSLQKKMEILKEQCDVQRWWEIDYHLAEYLIKLIISDMNERVKLE